MSKDVGKKLRNGKSQIDFMLDGKKILSALVEEDEVQNRQVPNLSNEQLVDYEVMGSAEGENFEHCVWLGAQGEGVKVFFKKVGGFQLVEPDSSEYKFAVTFYEPKKSS